MWREETNDSGIDSGISADVKSVRRRNLDFGKFAEERAKELLVADGYAIRERNWRCGKMEIDIIAQTETTMVFVEVKARSGEDVDAAETVTPEKIRLVCRAADRYLQALDYDFDYRFDIIAITGNMSDYIIEHFPDAFLPPLSRR